MKLTLRTGFLAATLLVGLALGCTNAPLSIGSVASASTCETNGGTCTPGALCGADNGFSSAGFCPISGDVCCVSCPGVDLPECLPDTHPEPVFDELGCVDSYTCADGGVKGGADGGSNGFDAADE